MGSGGRRTDIVHLSLLGEVLYLLCYVMLFHLFVQLNQVVIKITHFAILLLIFLYAGIIFANLIFEQVVGYSKKCTQNSAQESLVLLNRDKFSQVSPRIHAGSINCEILLEQ